MEPTALHPELLAGARSLALFLLDVARHHTTGGPGEVPAVHLVALGAPGPPAILVLDAAVVDAAAQVLRAAR